MLWKMSKYNYIVRTKYSFIFISNMILILIYNCVYILCLDVDHLVFALKKVENDSVIFDFLDSFIGITNKLSIYAEIVSATYNNLKKM